MRLSIASLGGLFFMWILVAAAFRAVVFDVVVNCPVGKLGGVGLDFCHKQIGIGRQRHPGLNFDEGDAEDAATLDAVQGPFGHILVLDT
jgi:hypothetical protein